MRGVLVATTWFALAAAACGDAGGGGDAGQFQCDDDWCEGDPAGSWTIVAGSVCLSEPIGVSSCPELRCDLKEASASGTLVLPADPAGGAADFAAEGTLDCAVPAACLTDQGCADLPGTCTATEDGCDCEVPFASATVLAGTWTLDQGLGLLQIENAAEKRLWATTNFCAADGRLDFAILSQIVFSSEIGLVSIHLRVRASG